MKVRFEIEAATEDVIRVRVGDCVAVLRPEVDRLFIQISGSEETSIIARASNCFSIGKIKEPEPVREKEPKLARLKMPTAKQLAEWKK